MYIQHNNRDISISLVSLDEIETLPTDLPLMVDFETTGLTAGSKICIAQFYQKGSDKVYLVFEPHYEHLAEILTDREWWAHYATFEVAMLQHFVPKFKPKKVYDTYLLSRLKYYNLGSFTLDKVAKAAIGYDVYDSHGLDKKDLQKSNWDVGLPSKEQLIYCSLDVILMVDIIDDCQEYLEDNNFKVDSRSLIISFDFQTNGYPISLAECHREVKKNKEALNELSLPINYNSYVQVRDFLGLAPDHPSDANTLNLIALGDGDNRDNARKVVEARKKHKLIGFAEKNLSNHRPGLFELPSLFGHFGPYTVSGRFNCNDMNLQQLPRAQKHLHDLPEGYKFIFSDFSQLELRTVCVLAEVEEMCRLYEKDEDLHVYTANLCDCNRQLAKNCNFGLVYGGSANMLQSLLVDRALYFEIDYIRQLRKKWQKTWPSLVSWQNTMFYRFKKSPITNTLLGRKVRATRATDYLNIPVQGTAADVSKHAMYLIDKQLADKPVYLVNFVHDSYAFLVEDNRDLYIEASHIVADCMQKAWFTIMQNCRLNVPMPVTVSVGNNIKTIEDEYDYQYTTPLYMEN